MFRSLAIWTCLFLTASSLAAPLGSDRKPLKEAKSLNGRFELRITAGRAARGERKPCVARLIDRGRETWDRQLVNDIAPVYGAVSDDGKFAVTLDEFRRGGSRNALVVYGEDGKLLRHFVLTDLLERDDWKHLKVKGQSVSWLKGAEIGFDDDSTHFIIDLEWGRQVAVDLRKLCVVRDGQSMDRTDVPPEIAALLESPAASVPVGDPPSIEELAKKSKISQEDLERLVEMGILDPDDLAAKLEEMAEKGTLELPKIAKGNEKDGPAELTPEQIAAAKAEKEAIAKAEKDAAAKAAAEQPMAVHDLRDAVGAVASGGIHPPVPDPANPVNYLEWINSQSPRDGVDAAPIYEQAISQFRRWDGDQELFDRAMKGDPAALNSPEIAAWLDSNRTAMELYRQGASADYRGWNFKSDTGRVWDVLLPDLGKHREIARATSIEAQRLVAEGRANEAIDLFAMTAAAGAQVGHGPTLIENLVGVAMQSQATEAMLDQFANPNATIDYVSAAAKVEKAFAPTRSSAEAMQFERSMFYDFAQTAFTFDPGTKQYRPDLQKIDQLQSVLTGGQPSNNPLQKAAAMFRYGTLDFQQTVADGDAYYDAVTTAAETPYVVGRQLLTEAERSFDRANTNPLLKSVAPAMSRAHFNHTRGDASRRAAVLVANLQAYKQQHGDYPDSLDAFGGREYTVDPFTGSPFAYRRDNAGNFTLYSLGANGADDNGVNDPKGETNDITYWPRPAKE